MQVNRLLRLMAWERAKGELRALLRTYQDSDDRHCYEAVRTVIDKFTSKVTDTGLLRTSEVRDEA